MAGSSSKTGKSTDYQFQTVWRVAGTREEVVDVLGDAGTLKQWWPAVYLDVRPAPGVEGAYDLHTKGWLPYTLRWRLTPTEPATVDGFALTAKGDLNGTGRWTFETDGPEVVITYDWHVSTAKPLLRRLSWLLKPAFSANHHWAMARGEESLKLELRRRRSTTGATNVPAPPGPTFTRKSRKHAEIPGEQDHQ